MAFPTPEQAAQYGIRVARVFCQPNREELDQISQLVATNQLQAQVAQVFPLEQVGAAQKLSKAGRIRGKIILQPANWA